MAGKIYYATADGDKNSIAVYHSGWPTHIAFEMSTHESDIPLDAVRQLVEALQEMLKEYAEDEDQS